jgi:single-strand DNA-binding protein
MASLNKVLLLGNLTRDPELRYTPNGAAVASFGLAVNRRYQQAEEWKDEVCFIDVVVFGRQAQPVSEYLSKGSPALIEGHLRWRSWEGQDGQKRSKHEVIAERVQFMSRGREEGMERPSSGSSGMERPAGNMGVPRGMDDMDFPPPGEDDIPF